MSGQCSVCKAQCDDVRISTMPGYYGPVDTQTCQRCHEREIASCRAENRRLHMNCRLPKPWAKLTTRGAYSEVR